MATRKQLEEQAKKHREWANKLRTGAGAAFADYQHAAALHDGLALLLQHEALKLSLEENL